MKLIDYVQINRKKFEIAKYPNAKKFQKVKQKALKPHNPYFQYEKFNKKEFTHRDIYMADKGDVILCLMNTKVRLIGIVDCLCVVPNTFCVLHPVNISTEVLYALLQTKLMQKQLENDKPSIKIKDVENMMFPYEINAPEAAVLKVLSENYKNSLLERKEVNESIDTALTNAKWTMPLKLDYFVHCEEITQHAIANSYGKRELPDEGIIMADIEGHDSVTLLLSRKMKKIEDLKVGLIPNDRNIHVNQNLIKLQVDPNRLQQIGFDLEWTNCVAVSKYLAYYFLSSNGKKQLAVALETKGLNPVKTLKVNQLKEIDIPIPIKEIPYIVNEIEAQINWHDTTYYFNQLEYADELFQQFTQLLTTISDEKEVTHFVDKTLFDIREYAFYLAKYVDHNERYKNVHVGVVLESWVHYGLFSHQDEEEWADTSVEFYSPDDDIDADIIIVIQPFDNMEPLKILPHAKVIYIRGMK